MGFRPVEEASPDSGPEWPWEDSRAARGVVFACLGATGSDPGVDGLFRLQATRRGPLGAWESFERFCDPFPGSEDEAATRRMVLEHGVAGSDLDAAPPAEELAALFLDFLGPGPVVVPDADLAEPWLAWLRARAERREPAPLLLGLEEARGLFLPGRAQPAARPATPNDLRRALGECLGEFLTLDERVLELALSGLAAGWERLSHDDPPLAASLGAWLSLAEHPSHWGQDPDHLFQPHDSLVDGRLRAAAEFARVHGGSRLAPDPLQHARELIEVLEPRCAEVGRLWAAFDTVPVDSKGELALEPSDLSRLDEVFEVHLPALAGERQGGVFSFRAGQRDVARKVAAVLGSGEVLLVSAPTGTGKTLAYLAPALAWALKNQVRVGISTYTRTLQEQAARREVPRALAALTRAGLVDRPRVSLLKGRGNYLCWRSLRSQSPASDDGPETILAWTLVCLFALSDDDGDLDHLPQRFPLGARTLLRGERGSSAGRYQRELSLLVRAVRAQTSCCTRKEDRETCAAEVARARAERSHVVLTNHAFALARQAFFKHVVFDECEHLHDQAHGAWSHQVTTSELGELLARLSKPGRPGAGSRAVLDRLAQLIPAGIAAGGHLESARVAFLATRDALKRFEHALAGYKTWRDAVRRERDARDDHALLREFIEGFEDDPAAALLLEAREDLARAGSELEGELANLATRLDSVPARGLPRLRRALELTRSDLVSQLEALEAWIPVTDGQANFRPDTFHDVETDLRGRDVLAARVLLPNEFLGRHYYPQLRSAVLISATTWLKDGFESSAGYLGLDRAADPEEGEEREPTRVRTFRSPEVFDYGRVLVGVPNDAPEVRNREAWLGYVRRFIAHLGERTRGRMLVLFTNAEDARRTGEALAGFFRARRIPLWWQNMPGVSKEELPALFRARADSILFGLDTFWYGADFPGESLEYLVIPRLPYGVPDRYHHAQCAALGAAEQRRRIYMPRALAKLRQGFGRLMRRESDRGAVFLLDRRVLDPRHRTFLRELPLAGAGGPDETWNESGARLLTGDTDEVVHGALAHMGMLADVRRRGLDQPFGLPSGPSPSAARAARADRPPPASAPRPLSESMTIESPPVRPSEPEILDVPPEDVPF